jgi:hypothetical protein
MDGLEKKEIYCSVEPQKFILEVWRSSLSIKYIFSWVPSLNHRDNFIAAPYKLIIQKLLANNANFCLLVS